MLATQVLSFFSLAMIGQASVLPATPRDSNNVIVARANICNPGEVGVGTLQQCDISGGCYGTFASILSHDCGRTEAMSNKDQVCANDYSRGWRVSCSGGNPNEVTNPNNKRYANCYKPSKTFCGFGAGISTIYINVKYCCQPI
ncbi:hypothetical protein QBC40DRAFT_94743 [Triangularia verruculosa]|uniref:Secreted protein n=1 Tax=Triangularia verruculosa TaxID=2587418 RepID=A0AAN7AT24_9PEZI|nr:hypothetical protein QBC40DRAFT_94743 [Triangularia verruculosa]